MTRSAYRVGPWAVKIPNWGWWLRGWLANQSEWYQRRRPDVARPVFTLFHFALVMPAASSTLDAHVDHSGVLGIETVSDALYGYAGYDGDEAKLTSWGLFWRDDELRWLLIDFDRAWQQPRRGLLCRAYYWNQDRLGRKWARLAQEEP